VVELVDKDLAELIAAIGYDVPDPLRHQADNNTDRLSAADLTVLGPHLAS
jgi:hypothetical protein